jgi:site-specific recombinase XerD
MQRGELATLLDSWVIHLRAERKSPETIKAYTTGVRQFLAWSERTETPPALNRRTVGAFVASLFDTGVEGATARSRQLSVRRFSAWLAEEGEIGRDELVGMRPPKLDQKITESLTDDECRALLKACEGRRLKDRRDEAIVRMMLETGARCDEVVSQTVADVRVPDGIAVIRRGKGGKGRTVYFGPSTGRAIDRYLRLRKSHKLADTPKLWLGENGCAFAYGGLWDTLKKRARVAGLQDFHPHLLRHTAAARWLDAGGSEGGLMAMAGWARRDMIDRYTKATSERRAAEEARRLGLGDRL